MRIYNLGDMKKGWFVGDFEPSAYKTPACEIAIKRYAQGDREAAHVHRQAVEITAVVHGRIAMNGNVFSAGDIVMLERGEACDFVCLEDAITVVYKSVSNVNDKFYVADN